MFGWGVARKSTRVHAGANDLEGKRPALEGGGLVAWD